MADEATERIVLRVPAYRTADEQFRADVRAHVVAHLRASLESLGADREVTREDLLFVRPHAARRAKRVSVTEFVQAFYVGERVLWDTALGLAARRRVAASRAGVRVAPAALFRGRDHARRRGLPRDPGAARGHRRADPPRPARGPARRPRARTGAAARLGRGAAGLTGDAAFVVISATPYPAPTTSSCSAGARRRWRARSAAARFRSRSSARTRSCSSCRRTDGVGGDARAAAHRRPAAARRRRPAARRGRQHRGVAAGADPRGLP